MTVPIANVIPKPIASVTAFGCADIMFRSLFFIGVDTTK